MSNPRNINGSAREGTRVVLREITASLHNCKVFMFFFINDNILPMRMAMNFKSTYSAFLSVIFFTRLLLLLFLLQTVVSKHPYK